MNLKTAKRNSNVKILHIQINDDVVLHQLNQIGLYKNQIVRILDYKTKTNVVNLVVNSVEYALGNNFAEMIEVEYVENKG